MVCECLGEDRPWLRLERGNRAAYGGHGFRALPFHAQDRCELEIDPGPTETIASQVASAQQDVFWGKDCGADEYLTKPFSTKELVKTIDRLLKVRQQQQQQQSVHASGVAEELLKRHERGEDGRVVHLEWDPRAMDIFRKKYGEFKLGEAYRQFRAAAEQFLKDHDDPGPVELHDVNGLTLVLRGGVPEAKKAAAKLVKRLNEIAAGLYAAEDRDRGFIPFRNPRTSQEEKLPLLSFSPRIVPDKAA